ncbi:MAG: YggT family protein [Clostridia bacterium]|jgi:hypothetical protein|nr:YggT family protein [Clostridia bacterium]
MEAVFYITAKVISIFLSAVSFAMLVRVILQLVSMLTSFNAEENKFYIFCFAITEIFVTPIRYLCERFNLFTNTPIDAPFFIAYLLISILQSFLPII